MAKQKSPYMTHMLPGVSLNACEFVPFEDVLGLGHSDGVSSMLVPGEWVLPGAQLWTCWCCGVVFLIGNCGQCVHIFAFLIAFRR